MMLQVPVLAQNEQAKQAIIDFFANYREIIVQHMNTFMAHDGSPVDAGIQVSPSGEIEVYQLAPDKGLVIVVSKGEIPVQFANYRDVEDDTKYVVQEGDRIPLYVKTPEGEPDLKVGVFKRLMDVVAMANDEKVIAQIEQTIKDNKAIRDSKAKRAEKGQRKLEAAKKETNPA